MALARKAGYGICMDSVSKKLIRVYDSWFNCSIISSAYCSRTNADGYWNNPTAFAQMQQVTRDWLNGRSSSDWVASASQRTPVLIVGEGTAVTVNGWRNECTQLHAMNRFTVPSSIDSYQITGVRVWLESVGEIWHDTIYSSNGVTLIYDGSYVPANYITGSFNLKLSSLVQAPSFPNTSPSLSVPINTITEDCYYQYPECSSPYLPNIHVGRFPAGNWACYDLNASDVSFVDANRTFYAYMNWVAGNAPYFYANEREWYTYFRSIRSVVISVFCEL